MKRLTGALCGLVCLLALHCSAAFAEQARLTIFYTTDTHGHIVSSDKTIGLDLIGAAFRAASNAVLVDAGDFSQGLPYANMSKGKEVVRLMKKAGYFAAAAGNHEFDNVPEEYLARFAEAPGPDGMHILSANIQDASGKQLLPSFASLFVDDVRLCFYGLTTQETPAAVTPANVAGLVFADPLAAARGTSRALKQSGCDIVVALTHLGSTPAVKVKSEDVAEAAPDTDIVIDGHSHVTLERYLGVAHSRSPLEGRAAKPRFSLEGVPVNTSTSCGGCHVGNAGQGGGAQAGSAVVSAQTSDPVQSVQVPAPAHSARPRIIVSSGCYAERLGRLDILFDRSTRAVTGIANTQLGRDDLGALAPDPQLAAELNRLRKEVELSNAEVIVRLPYALEGGKKIHRLGESPLGNMAADAFRAAYGDDIAIINGGAIRQPLPQGEVRRLDVLASFPYQDPVVSVRVTGAELKEVLEHAYSFLPDAKGAFAQVSGITVRVNPGKAAGERVAAIALENGEAILPDKEYSLSVNSFLVEGGDGYPVLFAKAHNKDSLRVDEALARHLRGCDLSQYAPGRRAERIFME